MLAFPFARTLLTEGWKKRTDREKIKIIWWTAVYIIIAIATIRYFFWGYQWDGIDQARPIFWQNPIFALKYYIVWLGSPLRYEPQIDSAIIVGVGILFLVFISVVMIGIKWKYSSDTAVPRFCYPWICLIAYGILTGFAITSGRLHFGLGYALSSRYTTNSLLVIIGLVGIFYTLWNYEKSRHRVTTNVTFGIIIGVISILTVASWIGGYRGMQAKSLRSQQNLLTLRLLHLAPSNPLLNRLYIDPEVVRKRGKKLIEHGILNVDQIGNWLKEKIQAPHGEDAGWFRVSNNVNENKILVSGWAVLPGKGVPPDFVVLAKKDRSGNIEIVTGLTNTIKRPDVVEEKHNPKLLLSGFEDSLENTYIDGNQFLMFAVDINNQRVYELRKRM